MDGLQEEKMKKFAVALTILCGLLIMTGNSWAYTITVGSDIVDVGSVDIIIAKAALGNSGNEEIQWLKNNDFTVVEDYKGSTLIWYNVSSTSIWAAKLQDSPLYYFIKIGTGGTSILYNHFIYENNTDMTWMVIDLAGWGGGTANNIDVGRVSHVGEGVSVPEPSILILLGTGLLGIVGISRRK